MVNRFLKYLAYTLFIFTILVLIWFVVSVGQTTDNLKQSVEKHTESSIFQFAKKFSSQITKDIPKKKSLPQFLESSNFFQKECNSRLELIRSKYVPYIYMLWLDRDGKFRFLCDGSLQKSHFFQKFDPGNFLLWQTIYKNGIAKTIDQQKYKGLWKSLLYPIKIEGESQALLVLDYSTQLPNKIEQIIKPFKTLLVIILLSIFLLLFVIIIQIFHSFFVKKKTYIDPLTGVYNRRFLQNLSKKIILSQYDIVMIDLDHFKRINDTYGHITGDKALKYVVGFVKNGLSKKDYLIRFGGEEFIVLLYNQKGNRNSLSLAKEILKKLNNNSLLSEEYGEISVKASIGVNREINKENNFELAIKNADKALYAAKKAGRNCVVEVNSKLSDDKIKKVYSFTYIKELIERELVHCYYQPIFSNKMKKIVKYEVLVRLKDKNGKIIMPSDFLSTIWHTNVYQKLTRQIIESSVDIFRDKSEKFSINLGLQDILDEKIFSIIEEIALREPSTISRMGIEILEYDRFENISRLENIIVKLKSFGISIILDDFGSGHANYSIVEKLAIDELKIDGSIVEHVNTNDKSKFLLESLAMFAVKSKIKTTVEYVSSKKIYDAISKMPFDNLQGFYLGLPQSQL